MEPLVSAVVRDPGLAADPAALTGAVAKIVGHAKAITETAAEQLIPDEASEAARKPMKAILGRTVARWVGESWQRGDFAGDAAETRDRLARTVVEFARIVDPGPDQVFGEIPRTTETLLGEANAVAASSPVLLRLRAMKPGARRLFLGDLEPEAFAGRVRDLLREWTVQGIERVVGADGEPSETHLRVAEASVRNTLSAVFAHVLETNLHALGADLKTMDASRRKAFLGDLPNHPNGVLLSWATTDMQAIREGVLFPLAGDDSDPVQGDGERETVGPQ